MAFTTRSLSKPISMMFATALSYSGPDNRLDAPKPAEAALVAGAVVAAVAVVVVVVVVVGAGLAAGAEVVAGLVVAAVDAVVAGFEVDEFVVGY